MGMVIICYSIKDLDPSSKKKFSRKLYGFKEYSNFADYEYDREGLLKEDEFKKLYNSVLLIDSTAVDKVLNLLKKLKVDFKAYKIKTEIR